MDKESSGHGTIEDETDVINRQQYEAAADEWDALPDVQCVAGGPDGGGEQPAAPVSSDIDFTDAWTYFKGMDLAPQMASIHPTIERKGVITKLLCGIFGPPSLDKRLVSERDRIFAIAQRQLDNEEHRQIEMLTTIYKRLTGTRLDCPRYGNHWESIGFQGSDPSTDLRGAGLLSLVNALFLVSGVQYRRLATDAHRLSQHEQQNFPFMVLSINITRLTLNALRHGVLNRECNLRLSVIDVFNEYYVCLLCEFYRIWKSQGRTIADSGNVLKDLEHQSLRRYKALRSGLCTYLSQARSREAASRRPEAGDSS